MQPLSTVQHLRQQRAIAWSRRMFANGVSEAADQWEVLNREFGFTYEETRQIYALMREEITREITEAKQNPWAFAAKRHKARRDRETAPWSVRIAAQMELDDVYDLVKVAQEPEGWSDDRLQEAWAFYEKALKCEKVTESQRHRIEKRQELLLLGPKRLRRTEAAKARVRRDRGLDQPVKQLKWNDPLAAEDQTVGPPIPVCEDSQEDIKRELTLLAEVNPDYAGFLACFDDGEDGRESSDSKDDVAQEFAPDSPPVATDVSSPPAATDDSSSSGKSSNPPVRRTTPSSPSDSLSPAVPDRIVASDQRDAAPRAARLAESSSSDDEVPPQAQPPP